MKTLKTYMLLAVLFALVAFSACNKNEENDISGKLVNFDAAFVINSESNSISVINLETNKVEKTIDLALIKNNTGYTMGNMNMDGLWPHHINISPDGSKLAIAAPGMDFSSGHNMMQESGTTGAVSTGGHLGHHLGESNTGTGEMEMQGRILVVDAVTGVLLKELILDGMTHNAVFSPDSKEIWAGVMMNAGAIKVYDASTFTLINSISVGEMPMELTFSEDGKKAYVTNGNSGTVSIIDVVTKQVINEVATGQVPVGAWQGMNGMMYISNEDSQSINMLSMMTNMMTDSLNLGFMPGMVMSDPMMDQMLVTDPENSLMHFWSVTDTGFMHEGEVTTGNGTHFIALSNDGRIAYVTNQLEGTVSVVDVKARIEILKIPVGVKPNGIVVRYN